MFCSSSLETFASTTLLVCFLPNASSYRHWSTCFLRVHFCGPTTIILLDEALDMQAQIQPNCTWLCVLPQLRQHSSMHTSIPTPLRIDTLMAHFVLIIQRVSLYTKHDASTAQTCPLSASLAWVPELSPKSLEKRDSADSWLPSDELPSQAKKRIG